MRTREFEVQVADRTLPCLLAEPEQPASDPALVVTFAGARRDAMATAPYDCAARAFVEAGHRAVSLDLPCHGDRGPTLGAEMKGMVAMFSQGIDPFALVVEDGIAAIDACIAQGLARPGRIYAYGVSRGGYCALRLTAADPRIAGVAGIAPVTDWRTLVEWSAHVNDPRIEAMALTHDAPRLAQRHVYAAIGFRDDRVGTDRCTAFMAEVLRAQAADPVAALTEFHIDPGSKGHGLDRRFYADGARFLVDRAAG